VGSILLQLALLILLTAANFWGPLLIAHPRRPAHDLFVRALRLVWRCPGPSLLLSLAVLAAAVIGVISIGGLFLAVPVIIVLLQTQMFRYLARTK